MIDNTSEVMPQPIRFVFKKELCKGRIYEVLFYLSHRVERVLHHILCTNCSSMTLLLEHSHQIGIINIAMPFLVSAGIRLEIVCSSCSLHIVTNL